MSVSIVQMFQNPPRSRKLQRNAVIIFLFLLPVCVLLEAHIVIVILVAATTSALLFLGQRSIHRTIAAISFALAQIYLVLWGQSLWADIAKNWQFGSHYLNAHISPGFLYLSHARPHPGFAPGWTVIAEAPGALYWLSYGTFDRAGRRTDIDTFVAAPWLLPALLMIDPAVLVILGLDARRRRRLRIRNSLCVGCGYNLIGNVSGACPECGTPR